MHQKSNYKTCRYQIKCVVEDLKNNLRHRENPLYSNATTQLREAFLDTAETLGFQFTAHDSSMRASSPSAARTITLRYTLDLPCLRLEIRKPSGASGTKEFTGEVNVLAELERLRLKALNRKGNTSE
jgi:hypothetical protein